MRRLVVWAVITFVILSSLVSALISFNIITTQKTITAKASDSHVFLCINEPPIASNSSCPGFFNQSTSIIDNRFTCAFAGNDTNGDSFTFSLGTSPTGVIASITSAGAMTMNATQSGVGNQSIIVYINDSSNCTNNQGFYNHSFEVLDINDPPEYLFTIPDINFSKDSSISPYSLEDFFSDPDGDALNFSALGANAVTITINPFNGNVIYTSTKCGIDYVIFTATDPSGLFASSGVVRVESTCDEEESTSSSGGGSGSGSGGGSGPVLPPCIPKWECKDWSTCDINGTQFQPCIDVNGCKEDDWLRYFYRNCTYIPTCFDGVQNGDEEFIDCGGSCDPCGSCFDGLQNNDEEAIDCGGTFCEPCFNCTNGIQDWEEEGVDCGGPICGACPSCFDGIQNQNETGIDCGGSCNECPTLEIPSIVEQDPSFTWLIILLVLLILGLIFYKLYRKKIKQLIAALGWYFARKNHKQFLLTNEDKVVLLKKLAQTKNKGVEGMSEIGRDIFSRAFNLQFEFLEEEFNYSVEKLVHIDALKKVFLGLFKKIHLFETKAPGLSSFELEIFEQELRVLVFQISHITKDDLLTNANEKGLTGDSSKDIFTLMYNALLALQFEELSVAKKKYLSLLGTFEDLKEKQKTKLFDDVARLYQTIKYQLSWVKE